MENLNGELELLWKARRWSIDKITLLIRWYPMIYAMDKENQILFLEYVKPEYAIEL